MPVFRYAAVDRRGRELSGQMPAHDENNLDEKLRNIGLWLTEAVQEKPAAATDSLPTGDRRWFRARSGAHRRELIDFCTLMAFQVKVGIPLTKALDVASQDCKDPGFGKVIRALQNDLESGMHLYEALAKYPRIFSTHFVSIIRAGELSSKLPETFDDLRKYLEWVEQVVADVRQATLYPAIVLGVIIAFVIFLFTFIIPKFAEMLDKLKVEQPMLTQIVFGLGYFAKATWWIWIPLFFAVLIGVPLGKKYSPRFAYFLDELKLKLPVFGELNKMLALSRFSHNLAIIYRSGVSILQALALCRQGLIGNKVVEKAVTQVEEDVKTGSTISEAIHRHPVFSAMLLRMINMGETTGNLDKALENVSDYYNDIIPRKIKAGFAVLEPAIMLLLIFIVGCVALAIYLPILSLMGAIKG